jgi:chromate reductase, NAD(P)H dehydrogenase (quinone)
MSERGFHVLAIAGSLRRGSVNRMLLSAAAQYAPEGMAVTVYEGLDAVPLFNEDLEADDGPQAVQRLRRAVFMADGLLISTPEYNHSLPGVLKNALDWLSRPDHAPVLVGKPIAIMGATAGRWGTRLAQAALRQTLNASQALVLLQPSVFVSEAAERFNAGGQLIDESTRSDLRAQLLAFREWMVLMLARSESEVAPTA